MTAEEPEYESIDQIFEDWAWGTNSDRHVCLRLIKEFVDKQLSEHSALKEQEVVAWIIEGKHSKFKQITESKELAEYLTPNGMGFTITELVKKTV